MPAAVRAARSRILFLTLSETTAITIFLCSAQRAKVEETRLERRRDAQGALRSQPDLGRPEPLPHVRRYRG